MSAEGQQQPIIVIKKKSGHAGHHGGAWKVAYADFVTAMMALFIVLWLMSSDEKVKKAVGGYFADPTGNGKQMGSNMAGAGEAVTLTKEDMAELKNKIEAAMHELPKFEQLNNQVKVIVTNDGLRIEMLETEKGMFFESGSALPTSNGQMLLSLLAEQIKALPNKILIEGHTDAKPYADSGGYSNWELSADRANAARRFLMEHGLRPDQVKQVRGFADQTLLKPEDPTSPTNRRVSVIITSLTPRPVPASEERAGEKKQEPNSSAEKETAKPASAKAEPQKAPAAKSAH